jgi:hypothetical protein
MYSKNLRAREDDMKKAAKLAEHYDSKFMIGNEMQAII